MEISIIVTFDLGVSELSVPDSLAYTVCYFCLSHDPYD